MNKILVVEDDLELNEMLKDLVKVLHDVEWWQSGDISEESYRETVTKFKKKWFKRDKTQVKNVIDSVFEKEKQELYETFKYLEEEWVYWEKLNTELG